MPTNPRKTTKETMNEEQREPINQLIDEMCDAFGAEPLDDGWAVVHLDTNAVVVVRGEPLRRLDEKEAIALSITLNLLDLHADTREMKRPRSGDELAALGLMLTGRSTLIAVADEIKRGKVGGLLH